MRGESPREEEKGVIVFELGSLEDRDSFQQGSSICIILHTAFQTHQTENKSEASAASALGISTIETQRENTERGISHAERIRNEAGICRNYRNTK